MLCILIFLLPLDGALSEEAESIKTLTMEAIKQITPGPAQENLQSLTKLLPKKRGILLIRGVSFENESF